MKLYEVFEDGSNYFLVMELMTGGEVTINTRNAKKLFDNILEKK